MFPFFVAFKIDLSVSQSGISSRQYVFQKVEDIMDHLEMEKFHTEDLNAHYKKSEFNWRHLDAKDKLDNLRFGVIKQGDGMVVTIESFMLLALVVICCISGLLIINGFHALAGCFAVLACGVNYIVRWNAVRQVKKELENLLIRKSHIRH